MTAAVTVDLIPPPRRTGDALHDAMAVNDWVERFYEAAVVQGGLIASTSLSDQMESQFPILFGLSQVAGAADNMVPIFTSATAFETFTVSDFARTLLDDANAAAMLATLGASTFTAEDVQDTVALLIQNGTGLAWTYDDALNQLTGNVSLAGFTTANLSENTNLYYTDERVDDRVAVLVQNGGGITWTYNDGAGTLTPTITKTLDSGQYTPTLTNVFNVAASTAYACQWLRVGDVVTVSGKIDIDPTATGTTKVGVSLPVASNFSANEHCGGTAVGDSVPGLCAAIRADAANDRAEIIWDTGSTTNQSMYFSFTYRII